MGTQQFVDAVLALPRARQQQQALRDYLQHGYAQAAALLDAEQRRQALVRHLRHAKECVCSLADPAVFEHARSAGAGVDAGPTDRALDGPAIHELDDISLALHRLQLVQSGSGRVFSMLRQVRYRHRHRIVRREYRDEDCGNYPLRDADHPTVHVRSARATSVTSISRRTYAYADVEPYLSPRVSKRARAALYRRRLQARTLTAEDLRSPEEQALIGQRGVFATAPIEPGSCVGVYGGQILDEADGFLAQAADGRYLINASPNRAGETFINGETLLSLMNTHFLFDDRGEPCGHPPTGYNVECADFLVEAAYGWSLVVYGFFAVTEIRPGDELRWNYRLGKAWT
ncbi:SET domain-containing protein [Schlegelella sp. S2-27]|uniref:SET domain-containing protein n=1 Tax=Caldimonas mangrovi TaxID=2944811 RepID=A0ABT0YRV2_9BURK|nr:SET domain-containing protein [Caldimonas mangrovi]MCM5681462.1 SET domain-containing protein [Caldimonas mangrovi]